jgi:hypothetical protein
MCQCAQLIIDYRIKESCPCAELNKLYAMNSYGGSGCMDLRFLTLALVRGELSASCPYYFTLEEAPDTHFIRSLVDPRTSVDNMGLKTPSLGSSSP